MAKKVYSLSDMVAMDLWELKKKRVPIPERVYKDCIECVGRYVPCCNAFQHPTTPIYFYCRRECRWLEPSLFCIEAVQ